jgi:hypothetical protein
MNSSRKILAVAFLIAGTLLTITAVTTMVPAAYAGGDNDGDGNKQKAEDDSSAAIADCDDNEVEQAGFDCIAIAANDVEIETEPPEEESATLSVCKEMSPFSLGRPDQFTFTVTGNGPEPAQFLGDPNCVEVTIGPGEYAVSEVSMAGDSLISTSIEGECMQDPTNELRATGEIQAGETQECTFINNVSD